MNCFLTFLLVVGLGLQPIFAGPAYTDPKTEAVLKKNVFDFRDWLTKQLSQLPKTGPANQPKGNYSQGNFRGSRGSTAFSANNYNQAGKSDWAKAQVMDGLSTLSQQLSKTAGTAFALDSSCQLQQHAAQLKQSDDPDFQKIGLLYSQQAEALKTGDIATADRIANQVSAIPKPYVMPGYRPTQGESALVGAFNQVIATVIAGLGGVIGSLVVAQLLQALGIPDLGSLLGMGQNTGRSIASGQNPGTAMDYAGANVVQTGGGAVIQQLGTINVKPRQSQDSANVGGAPPAQ